MDALAHTHVRGHHARLADVTPDGSAIHLGKDYTLEGPWVEVADRYRPAVARLRTSRRLAGCTASDPIDGLFDDLTTMR